MKEIVLNTTNYKSTILIDESIKNVAKYISAKKIIIITDSNITKHYKKDFIDCPIIEIGLGERIKTLSSVEKIFSELIKLEFDRNSFLLGIGGGIVCDITGFVASIYLRGVEFGFVSTSLLSQVDASVGGKNGVNFNSYKNIIGNFNQPKFVICDTKMLQTLPKEEIKNGLGEIVKHSLIADSKMFDFINNNINDILSLNKESVNYLIEKSINIKSGIVEKDERENGERKKLNFGHTLAHAIEKQQNIAHGEAVSIGIVFASKISLNKGYISNECFNSIVHCLKNIGLPTKLNVDKKPILEAIKKDKKRAEDNISFVLLNKIGEAIVEEISLSELENYIYDLY